MPIPVCSLFTNTLSLWNLDWYSSTWYSGTLYYRANLIFAQVFWRYLWKIRDAIFVILPIDR